jgi:hypothetical protein
MRLSYVGTLTLQGLGGAGRMFSLRPNGMGGASRSGSSEAFGRSRLSKPVSHNSSKVPAHGCGVLYFPEQPLGRGVG